VRGLDPERIEQPGGVLRQIDDREALAGRTRAPDPAVVVCDRAEVRVECLQEAVSPVQMVAAEPLDQQQRLTLAALVVEQLGSVHGGVRHAVDATAWDRLAGGRESRP